jgi:hypothetical protein
MVARAATLRSKTEKRVIPSGGERCLEYTEKLVAPIDLVVILVALTYQSSSLKRKFGDSGTVPHL